MYRAIYLLDYLGSHLDLKWPCYVGVLNLE